MKWCFGADVGGTTVKLGIVKEDGSIVEQWQIPTRTENGGCNILGDIAASIKEHMVAHAELDQADCAGVGMGVPGPVEADGYVEVCVNLGWKDLNPAALLSGLLGGLPVKAGNDANVAALGEQWMGSGKGADSLMFFTLGTGVGGGLIIDGKIVAGSKGMGAEVGHITVNEAEEDACNCKNHGCLEQYSSATGIVKEMKRALAACEDDCVLRGTEFDCAAVVNAAKAGDQLAESVVAKCMGHLATVMSFISYTVDPEVFVIGGGVSKAGDYLLDFIKPRYDHLTPLSSKKAGIRMASLFNDAGLYGAARMVLQ